MAMQQIKVRTAYDGKDSTGIKICDSIDGITEVIVPRYYMPDMEKNVSDLTIDERRKLRNLVKAWKKYQIRVKTKNNGELRGEGINYDFDSALSIVQDFLEYGLYIEFEKTEILSNHGKIDFPRTVKKCLPVILDEGPLYMPYITKIKKISDEDLVRNCQILVLNDISKKIGWLIGFNVKFPQTGIKTGISKSLITKLKMAKNNSFNSRKVNLINSIISYISMDEVTLANDKDNLFVSVVYKFWEDIVSEILGNVDRNTLDRIFYIRHRYINKSTGAVYKMKRDLNPLIPDSVYIDGQEIDILDAKYYDKRFLPDNDDITKQFAYMRKAYGYYGDTYTYKNIFVMPTDDHYHYSNREAVFDPDIPSVDDLVPIRVLYLNVSEAVQYYIDSVNISTSVI